MDDRLSEAMQSLGESCAQAGRMLREFVAAYLETFRALNAAPPRVRHLATYSRKGRVRKKTLHRALPKH